MPTIKELRGWLTAKDVADEFGVSRQYIHRLLENNSLPGRSVKTRLGWLVDPDDDAYKVERAIRQGRNAVKRAEGRG